MNEERRKELEKEAKTATTNENDPKGGTASRARNRTVMLTPEMTGQVRALLGNEEPAGQRRDPLADLLPPMGGGYTRPGAGRGFSEPSKQIDYAPEVPEAGGERTPTGRLRSTGSLRSSGPGANPPAFSVGAAPVSRGAMSSQSVTAKLARTKIIGFLVSFDKDDNGEVFEIRAGRWLLTSRPTDHSDYILIEDESISPLHAIVRATNDGKVQILDQLSEFGTAVTPKSEGEEQDITGSMTSVGHGDRIRFGKRVFTVCLVPKVAEVQGESSESGSR